LAKQYRTLKLLLEIQKRQENTYAQALKNRKDGSPKSDKIRSVVDLCPWGGFEFLIRHSENFKTGQKQLTHHSVTEVKPR
jgi:hypothetical protein